MKAAFQPHGLLLTAALTTDPSAVDKAYDVPALAQSLDYFHIMSYDYHNSGQYYTGANTPLHGENSLVSSLWNIKYRKSNCNAFNVFIRRKMSKLGTLSANFGDLAIFNQRKQFELITKVKLLLLKTCVPNFSILATIIQELSI